MQAQIAATLRHLKQSVTHLHDAKLIIEVIDKAAAQYIEQLVRATRDQIKRFEQLDDNQGLALIAPLASNVVGYIPSSPVATFTAGNLPLAPNHFSSVARSSDVSSRAPRGKRSFLLSLSIASFILSI